MNTVKFKIASQSHENDTEVNIAQKPFKSKNTCFVIYKRKLLKDGEFCQILKYSLCENSKTTGNNSYVDLNLRPNLSDLRVRDSSKLIKKINLQKSKSFINFEKMFYKASDSQVQLCHLVDKKKKEIIDAKGVEISGVKLKSQKRHWFPNIPDSVIFKKVDIKFPTTYERNSSKDDTNHIVKHILYEYSKASGSNSTVGLSIRTNLIGLRVMDRSDPNVKINLLVSDLNDEFTTQDVNKFLNYIQIDKFKESFIILKIRTETKNQEFSEPKEYQEYREVHQLSQKKQKLFRPASHQITLSLTQGSLLQIPRQNVRLKLFPSLYQRENRNDLKWCKFIKRTKRQKDNLLWINDVIVRNVYWHSNHTLIMNMFSSIKSWTLPDICQCHKDLQKEEKTNFDEDSRVKSITEKFHTKQKTPNEKMFERRSIIRDEMKKQVNRIMMPPTQYRLASKEEVERIDNTVGMRLYANRDNCWNSGNIKISEDDIHEFNYLKSHIISRLNEVGNRMKYVVNFEREQQKSNESGPMQVFIKVESEASNESREKDDFEQRTDLQLKVPQKEAEEIVNEPPPGGVDVLRPKGLKANSPFLMANSSEISWSNS
jgi:hypothetical protein